MTKVEGKTLTTASPPEDEDITAEVLRRFEGTPDPRLREIMLSLTRHIHAFVKDVRLNEGEWLKAIEFLTRTGQMCSDKRQEFILLSDTMGVSMLVDLISNGKPPGPRNPPFRPFLREGGPNCRRRQRRRRAPKAARPTIVTGRVLDMDGKPIAGAARRVAGRSGRPLRFAAPRDRENCTCAASSTAMPKGATGSGPPARCITRFPRTARSATCSRRRTGIPGVRRTSISKSPRKGSSR